VVELGPGTQLAGFRVVERLGRGGMGVVYRAVEVSVGRDVALKLLAPELASDAELVQRFVREARTVAALAHPGIITLHRAGSERGLAFLAFELVPGGSLEDRLKRAGPYPWREATLLAAEVGRALAAVHAAGVLHRDLKPANVLLDAKGRPKLADFGLALRPGEGTRLTETGALVGTPAYLAPEQIAGMDATAASDVYSLGCLVFALVASRPPFEGAAYSLLKKHALDAPPALSSLAPDVPRTLDRLVARMLSKEPGERPTSAAAADELERIGSAPARRSRAGAVAPWAIAAGACIVAFAAVKWERGPSPVSSGSPPPSPGSVSSATVVPPAPPSRGPAGGPTTDPPTQDEIRAAHSLREWDRVVERASARLEAFPHEVFSLDELAYALMKCGRDGARAERSAKEAIALAPEDYGAALTLAEVHRLIASHEVAEGDYRRAARLAPGVTGPWVQMFHMYRTQEPKDQRRALAIGEEAGALFPRDVALREARADLLVASARREEAVSVYSEGIELSATEWVYHVRRAEILADLGRTSEARRDVAAALERKDLLGADDRARLETLARALAAPTR
jgi:serine/threonine protein kinase